MLHNDLLQKLHLLLNDNVLLVKLCSYLFVFLLHGSKGCPELELILLLILLHSGKYCPEVHVGLMLALCKLGYECANLGSCLEFLLSSLILKLCSLVLFCSGSGNFSLLLGLCHCFLLLSDFLVNVCKLLLLLCNNHVIYKKSLLCTRKPLCGKNYVNTDENSCKARGDRSCDDKYLNKGKSIGHE